MVTPPVLHGWLLNGVCGVLNDSPPRCALFTAAEPGRLLQTGSVERRKG